uniref:Fatty-acid and retinol-binding protein 1 n=1 Tax=Panagrellus redivivus TaxID=6233 RepID=A0A7E4W394_PANRE
MLGRFTILAMCIVAAYAGALPYNFGGLPEQFKEFLPQEVKDFYAELTPEDKEILKSVALDHEKYENEDQALEALKAKSEKLHTKALTLKKLVTDRIDKLEDGAKAFVKSVIEKLRSIRPAPGAKPDLNVLRSAANDIIEQYKGLGDASKTSLKEAFPKITAVIQNEKFQKIAKGLLSNAGATPN